MPGSEPSSRRFRSGAEGQPFTSQLPSPVGLRWARALPSCQPPAPSNCFFLFSSSENEQGLLNIQCICN